MDGKFGDAAKVQGFVGRKFGDAANESVRFDGAVTNKALKSGDVEPTVAGLTSCVAMLGHTVSAPSSTWS